MIVYRAIKTKEDLEKAIKLCENNGLEFPIPVEAIFGAFDGDDIVGLSALEKIYQIEPIINITNHGHVSTTLTEKIMACASLVTTKIKAFVSRKENIDLYKKYGFSVVEDNVCHIEKSV